MATKKYTANSTQHIDAREFTRKRPSTYCGSTEYSTQLIKELFANALDEHIVGNGKEIKIYVDTKKNEYTCEDEGQGFIPGVEKPNGETMLSECFSVINTSGKYDDSDDSIYGGSALGLNGIGMKLVCYLSSESMISSSDGKGKRETLWYKDGLFQKREITDEVKGVHGTKITYIPDPQFFQHKEANLGDLRTLLKEESALCPELTVLLDIDGKEETYHSQNGIADLLDEKVKSNEILKNRFMGKIVDGNNLIDLCLTYTSNYSDDVVSYVNYGKVESGTHLTALRSSLTRAINKFCAEKDWFKKGEENLTGAELSEGLVLVFNLKAKSVKYDSQTKVRVTDIDKSLIFRIISEDFTYWMENNQSDIKLIFDKAMGARRAREAAKKARDAARATTKKKETGLKGKMELSDKFYDCTSKNPSERNLLLVEGLSAGGSALEARNVKTDCIYMLRGKTISPLKQSIDKILANQEMHDIIDVIGAGFGNDKFDVDKMQFDKIVITSDADSDGADIELLLITFFYTYMRPLVEAGKLYRAVTPLYIVTTKKDKYYCYTEEELAEWKSQHNESYELTHCKGLGEINASVLKEICFDHQRFKRITISDIEGATKILEVLQGQAVAPRKQFIYDNATKLGFNFM